MNRTFLYLPVTTALFLGLLLAPTAASAQEAPGGVGKDGTWYSGEGLKHGDFFSYRMCHVNYKECAPFEMDLWVKGDVQIASETQWLVEVAVFDGSKRVVGEMHLGKVASEPSSGAADLSEYRAAFRSSIVWLSAFATIDDSSGGKGPKEFRAISWGKIANIGGQQIKPQAIETVTVPAGTWETVQVGWHAGGKTSKVWVVDDFPFPIKAKTFTHVSSGIAPVEYEFTLLKYEENVQQSPFEGIESTVDPFAALGCDTDIEKDVGAKKSTAYFDYQIHLFYGPENPVQGCEIKWTINFLKFSDEKEFLNEVQYDIRVYDENLNQIRSIAQDEGKRVLFSPSGQALVEFTVKEGPGIATYVIWIYGLAPLGIVPSDSDDFLAVEVEILENDVDIVQSDTSTPPTGSANVLNSSALREITGRDIEDATKKSDAGGCLIATAAYGTELAPQVQTLREVRDNVFLNTELGSAFMLQFNQAYYSFSPAVADAERENGAFRELVKITITPAIYTLGIMAYADSEISVLMLGIITILLIAGIYIVVPLLAIRIAVNKVRKSNNSKYFAF